jgi:hypothetical protein
MPAFAGFDIARMQRIEAGFLANPIWDSRRLGSVIHCG